MSGTLSFDSPLIASEMAVGFLSSEPVLNNLILTLLEGRIARPEPGRYWIARTNGALAGVGLQSPPGLPLNLSAMAPETAAQLADAIAAEGRDLPGVFGEARIAARFAGQWAECCGVGVYAESTQRLYEAKVVRNGASVPGVLERADPNERPLAREWTEAFRAEVGGVADDVEDFVDRRIAERAVWLWRDGDITAMAVHTAAIAGVTRVQCVYTPPRYRRKGYAEALVRNLTLHLRGQRLRAMLYADLGNPTSNAIYRRIGYEPVTELVRYRFKCRSGGDRSNNPPAQDDSRRT